MVSKEATTVISTTLTVGLEETVDEVVNHFAGVEVEETGHEGVGRARAQTI